MADTHSISKRSRARSKGRAKTADQVAARQKLRESGVRGSGILSELFDAVGRQLGKTWATKGQGYDLLREFTSGYKPSASPAALAPRKKSATVHGVDVRSDDFLLSYEWRRLRMVVIKKRSPRCECCGATPADGHTIINVDHIKPRKLHPELALEESNLQILCHVCNHGKGNWDETDWRDWQPPEMYEPMWNSATVKPEPLAPVFRPDLPRLVKRKAS